MMRKNLGEAMSCVICRNTRDPSVVLKIHYPSAGEAGRGIVSFLRPRDCQKILTIVYYKYEKHILTEILKTYDDNLSRFCGLININTYDGASLLWSIAKVTNERECST